MDSIEVLINFCETEARFYSRTSPTEQAKKFRQISALLRSIAVKDDALKPLANIPIEDFNYREGQVIQGWNGVYITTKDVLAARYAIKLSKTLTKQ